MTCAKLNSHRTSLEIGLPLRSAPRCQTAQDFKLALSAGHDLSEFYEGGLEKGGFSKLNLRKVRRRPGGGGGVDEH